MISWTRLAVVGGTIVTIGAIGAAFVQGRSIGRLEQDVAWQARLRGTQDSARALEQRWRESAIRLEGQVHSLTQEQQHAVDALGAQYRDLVQRVQTRTARSDSAARAASRTAGDDATPRLADGSQLYREDSEFLVGEAARADAIRLALRACYTQYDAARTALWRATAARDTGQPPAPALDGRRP